MAHFAEDAPAAHADLADVHGVDGLEQARVGADKDLQEAWAIHGVYSQYAWLPDGRSIAIWAQGGFWRGNRCAGYSPTSLLSPCLIWSATCPRGPRR